METKIMGNEAPELNVLYVNRPGDEFHLGTKLHADLAVSTLAVDFDNPGYAGSSSDKLNTKRQPFETVVVSSILAGGMLGTPPLAVYYTDSEEAARKLHIELSQKWAELINYQVEINEKHAEA